MDTGNNTVSNVEVKHSARYGISLESRPEVKDGDQYASGNTFKYIKLEEMGLDSGDMGAFYTYGVDNQEPHPIQNTVDQLVIGDVIPDPSMPDAGGTRGVHMDAGGCGFAFSNVQVGKVTDQKYQSYQCNDVTNATGSPASTRPRWSTTRSASCRPSRTTSRAGDRGARIRRRSACRARTSGARGRRRGGREPPPGRGGQSAQRSGFRPVGTRGRRHRTEALEEIDMLATPFVPSRWVAAVSRW